MFKSSSWALGEAITLGGGKGKLGVGIAAYTLVDVEHQLLFPLVVGSIGIGASIPFSATVAEGGVFSFFDTTAPILPTEFNGLIYFGSLCEGAILYGQAAFNVLTFNGVDHDPYWINVSGLEAGFAFNMIGVSTGWVKVITGSVTPNKGCDIRSGGDPLCGGSSPMPTLTSGGQNKSGSP